ncbi:cytochrome c biogenesis protein DipZ [Candidatus Falkowbacteria bacterium]|nr:MAG: cytochrome c biogenesis protein DipZ [Candidatus Falkowbacteria bacterium]
MIELFLAFVAGILTIAAPCILLPLPILLGASVGQRSRARPLFITLGFIITFATLALFLNLLVQNLGLNPQTLRNGAAVLLLVFGFFMIVPAIFERITIRLSSLINKAGEASTKVGQNNFGGLLLGMLIGIIWAPCAGPILGSILTLISQQKDLARAGILLVAYAIGAGIPMLIIAYGGQALTTKVKSIAKYAKSLQKLFGLIIILLAIAVYFQYDMFLQAKILDFFDKNKTSEMSEGIKDKMPSFASSIDFKNYGQAPEFVGIDNWLNSEPLTVSQLKGKVVLVDFWTYSCINCIRTFPYITELYETYKDKGLIIVGVHTPEFPFEKLSTNVERALKQYGIDYPVAQDNDYATWNAYTNRYWPAKYLIDQNGTIVYTHFGEGSYMETENAIRQLLGLEKISNNLEEKNLVGSISTPEIYFGTDRLANLSPEQIPSVAPLDYTLPKDLRMNNFALEGKWEFDSEKIILIGDQGTIKLRFSAGKVFLVASNPDQESKLSIIVDGQKQPDIIVRNSELYNLFNSSDYKDHSLEIRIQGSGFSAFTFTFG